MDGAREIIPFGNILYRWGSQVFIYILSLFLCVRNHRLRKISCFQAMPSHGVFYICKIKLFPLSTVCPSSFPATPLDPLTLFFWSVCWNSFSRNLDFYKGSFIHEWLSKSGFSRDFWAVIHRPVPGSTARTKVNLSVPNAWVANIVLGPLTCGVRPWSSIKNTLSVNGCQIFIVGRTN